MASTETLASNQSAQTARFPIVGVVASAGGLDAFKQFLGAVPVDSDMAFVLVPHLDPTHESQMTSILSRSSLLPVVEATQGMAVEANHVYVIPSQYFLTIVAGVLQLSEPPTPQGRETAIDFFLRSLAKDQGERSIGIVLSGTGSHGTLGIRDIKVAGGMAIAQQPTTAEFDAMPSSVIRQGLADYVLPPAEMPSTLVQYTRQPYINQAQRLLSKDEPSELEHLAAILQQLRKHTHYDFGSYRKNMLLRRIQRRMGLRHSDNLQQYLDLITEDPQEATDLYRDLLISVTAFFRDPEAYSVLREQLLNILATRNQSRFPFRIWVAGCATGEEAYSLALLLIECLEEQTANSHRPADAKKLIQLFASDVDEAAIAIARAGIYPLSISADVSQERLARFFIQTDDGHYQIGKQLRESIVFSKQNLINDPPFSKLDLVSCRNLLIYLEPEMQQKVISLFHFALADGGILMLGPSESIAQADQLFEPISRKWRVFKKISSSRRIRMPLPLGSMRSSSGTGETHPTDLPAHQRHKELVEKALIDFYAPATVLVNRRYELLYMTGQLVDYLEFPTGEPNLNLLSMCRPGLRTKLRFACQKSIAEEVETEIATQVKRGKDTIECTVHIRILKSRIASESLLLISFSDKAIGEIRSQSDSPEIHDASQSSYTEQLERELKSNNEELGGVIEELEIANEDLKTSNEEIMSMNEELQSANEELETSKEELQSLNEELSTVNVELFEKVTELNVANNDILNLLSSTEIATLFLDTQLLIQRFTLPTVKLLNVRASDIGRPLSDITTRFVDDSLLSDCRQVIKDGSPLQGEIEGDESRMYLRRVLPYRSQGNQILGAVITFVDLTERLLLEKSLKQSNSHLLAILDSAVDSIMTVNIQGVVSRINPATERLFGYTAEEIIGKPFMFLLSSADGSAEQSQASASNMKPMSFFSLGTFLELHAKRKDASVFDAELAISRIDHLQLYIVVIRDVSQRKDLQRKILDIASDEQRRIGQELHDGTQQELSGLSLIAGTIKELLKTKIDSANDGQQEFVIDRAQLTRLVANATKLVDGLSLANRHVQSLSHGIMPVQIDVEGLISALTELASEVSIEGAIACNFVHSGSLTNQSNAVATHLFRIAQEAINNAIRHGAAKNIFVSFSVDQHQIQLEISDDGIGLDIASIKQSDRTLRGAGLQIMEYRANIIGGKLSILAGTNNGTIVRCTLPAERTLT